jgi:hypothetical protein
VLLLLLLPLAVEGIACPKDDVFVGFTAKAAVATAGFSFDAPAAADDDAASNLPVALAAAVGSHAPGACNSKCPSGQCFPIM